MGITVFGKTPVRLPLRVQTTKGDRRVDAMCDTGNTVSTGAAINAEFCRKIGLTWRRYKQREPIGPAKKSSKLHVLGVTDPFHVKGIGFSGVMTVTAQVIEDLSQELNLGARWLQQNYLSLHFSRQGTRIEKKLGGTVPLVAAMETGEDPEELEDLENLGETRVDTLEEVKIPPYQVRWVPIQVKGQERETAAHIVPVAPATQLGLQVLEGVYPLREGKGAVLLANVCAETIQIAAGSRIFTSTVGPVSIAEIQEMKAEEAPLLQSNM